jgi:aldehyde dehydrogenase (NAD+)/betaine-aldehyde dehydrogenase
MDSRRFAVDPTDVQMTIAGQAVRGGGVELEVPDPATEEVVAKIRVADERQAEQAIEAARRAFDEGPWGQFTGEQRSLALHRLAQVMEQHAEQLVGSIVAEVGSPITLADSLQVRTPLAHLRYYAEAASGIGPEHLGSHFDPTPSASMVAPRPVGVVAAITAYNYPILLAVSKIGAALAAGCTAVLMPSPRTPIATLLFGKIVREADLPSGVVNVIAGGADVARRLTESRKVDKVTFTGSTVVGEQVMRQAASGVKDLTLELGGKAPALILRDADLGAAVPAVHLRYSRNAGQGCMSPTRLLVHEERWDQFLELSKAAFDRIVVGDPWDPRTDVGPLIRPEHRARVERYVEEAQSQGATLAVGGGRPPFERGWYVNPALLVGVANSARIAREEIFGPVAVALPFSDTDDAIRVANDTTFGLAAYVYSGDTRRALDIAARLRAGVVFINGGGGLRPDAPVGGFKESGIGREMGRWGIAEYLQPQHVQWALG